MTEPPLPPTHFPDPVLVEVTRGPVVESAHRGAVAVCNAAGELVAAWGDVERPVYARSAVKALQALPLLESGAAARYGLSPAEIALACASHTGEARHVALVSAWLARLGLSEADLECGAHAPADAAAAQALLREGQRPSALHNNCSGKHSGFLTTALHLGEPTKGYIEAVHPVQRRVAQALAEMADCAEALTPTAIDGCGIPTLALPLTGVATAMARLADPQGLSPARRQAADTIRAAIAAHPELVAGSGKLCTEVMTVAPGVLVKAGAEGVYTAILPALGLGVALKIDDGAMRAAEVAILAVLHRLGALDAAQESVLDHRRAPAILNVAGRAVGMMRPCAAGWG